VEIRGPQLGNRRSPPTQVKQTRKVLFGLAFGLVGEVQPRNYILNQRRVPNSRLKGDIFSHVKKKSRKVSFYGDQRRTRNFKDLKEEEKGMGHKKIRNKKFNCEGPRKSNETRNKKISRLGKMSGQGEGLEG